MDPNLAIATHIEWKTRLRAAITNNETFDTASIVKERGFAV